MEGFIKGSLPFLVMMVVESVEVGLITLSKAAMSKGMSNFVFVVYYNALGTLFLLPSFSFHFFRYPDFNLSIFIFPFQISTLVLFSTTRFHFAVERDLLLPLLSSVDFSFWVQLGMLWFQSVIIYMDLWWKCILIKFCFVKNLLAANIRIRRNQLQLSYIRSCHWQSDSCFHFSSCSLSEVYNLCFDCFKFCSWDAFQVMFSALNLVVDDLVLVFRCGSCL